MLYSKELTAELNVLSLYDVTNNQEGIKVHKNADDDAIQASKRLHAKGLITQVDGGYLTDLGLEAAEHSQALLLMISN